MQASWDARSRPGRLIRAGVFAAASTVLAASAHRLAGGVVPGVAKVTLAAGLLLLLGCALARRERSGLQITVLVLVTQTLLHVSLMLSTMSHTRAAGMPSPAPLPTAELARILFCYPDTTTPSAAQVATAMAGMNTSHLTAAATPAATQLAGQMNDSPFTVPGLGMLTAHLVAAAAMAWWLRRGERRAWTAIERVVTTLTTASLPRLVPNAPRSLRVVANLWLPTHHVWGSGAVGRGPPAPRWNLLTT